MQLSIRLADGRRWKQPLSYQKLLRLGSDPAADIVVEAPGVAPIHCAFEYKKGDFRVRASSAVGGVDVNGTVLAGAKLKNGDVITIGDAKITLMSTDLGDVAEESENDVDELMQILESGDSEDSPPAEPAAPQLPITSKSHDEAWELAPLEEDQPRRSFQEPRQPDPKGTPTRQDQQRGTSSPRPEERGKSSKKHRRRDREQDRHKSSAKENRTTSDDLPALEPLEELDPAPSIDPPPEKKKRKKRPAAADSLATAGFADPLEQLLETDVLSAELESETSELSPLDELAEPESDEEPLAASFETERSRRLLLWGAGIVAVVAAAIVWFLTLGQSDGSQEAFASAADLFRQGNLPAAADGFDAYLKKYPKGDDRPDAYVMRSLARIRPAVDAQDPVAALAAASQELESSSEYFHRGEDQASLAALLGFILTGMEQRANRLPRESEVDSALEGLGHALALYEGEVPRALRSETLVRAARRTKGKLEHVRQRSAALSRANDEIRRAVEGNDLSAVYTAIVSVRAEYPAAEIEPGITAELARHAEQIASRVTREELNESASAPPTGQEMPDSMIVVPPESDSSSAATDGNEPSSARRDPFAQSPSGEVGVFPLPRLQVAVGLGEKGISWQRFLGPHCGQSAEMLQADDGMDTILLDERWLFRCRAADGSIKWRVACPPGSLTPTVTQRQSCVPTNTGGLYLFDSQTGNGMAHYQLPQGMSAPVALDSQLGMLYACGDHSFLYAVDLRKEQAAGVFPLGHDLGTIDLAPCLSRQLLIVPLSLAPGTGQVVAISRDADGKPLSVVQRLDLPAGPLACQSRQDELVLRFAEFPPLTIRVDSTKSDTPLSILPNAPAAEIGPNPAALQESLRQSALAGPPISVSEGNRVLLLTRGGMLAELPWEELSPLPARLVGTKLPETSADLMPSGGAVTIADGESLFVSFVGSDSARFGPVTGFAGQANRITLPGALACPPCSIDGQLVLPLDHGLVWRFDMQHGTLAQSGFQAPITAGEISPWVACETFDEHNALLLTQDGSLFGLSLDEAAPAGLVALNARSADLNIKRLCASAQAGSLLAVLTNDRLARVRLNSELALENLDHLGRVAWGPVRAGLTTVYLDKNRELVCLGKSLEELWRVAAPNDQLVGAAMAPDQNELVVATRGGILQGHQAQTGQVLWSKSLGFPLDGPPTSVRDGIVVYGPTGILRYVSMGELKQGNSP